MTMITPDSSTEKQRHVAVDKLCINCGHSVIKRCCASHYGSQLTVNLSSSEYQRLFSSLFNCRNNSGKNTITHLHARRDLDLPQLPAPAERTTANALQNATAGECDTRQR